MGDNGATTRAQWVVPKRRPSKTVCRSNENTWNKSSEQLGTPAVFRQPYHDFERRPGSSSAITPSVYTSSNLNHQRSTQSEMMHPDSNQSRNNIDDAICKTICVIVDQYLKELREHQRQINLARAKLAREVHHSKDDGNFIAFNDVSRLRVRDEQTKAIETIKQLTTYLRELSTIRRHEGTAELDPVSEEIHDRLSDLRNDIIHTLNDFVLANSDIDVPIVDLDDPTGAGRDYDLCMEVHRSQRDICEIEISHHPGGVRATVTSDLSQYLEHNNNKVTSQAHDGTQSHSIARRRPLASRNSNAVPPDETQPEVRQVVVSDHDDKYKLVTVHDDYQLVELDKRKREVHKLERDTVELRNLFVDFYKLVKMQGEQVDSLEDNLVSAAQQISEGRNHLQQRPLKALAVLLPMTGCLTGALIGGPIGFFVGGKLGGLTIILTSSLLGLLSSLGAQKCIETNRLKRI